MSAFTDKPSSSGAAIAPPVPTVSNRLFVVGCPRSGTTLLQSFVAAHPAVLSFPETKVFARLLIAPSPAPPSHENARARIEAAYARATAFLSGIGRADLGPLLATPDASITEFAQAFVAVLDRLTLDRGKGSWVEKTPRHLAVVSEIGALVPGARFIHILRDGRQNVASLHDLALKYPDVWWWARYRDLDQAIKTWNYCARQARALRNLDGVLLVRYERLVSETDAVLREICAFAGLPFRPEMIQRRAEAAGAVVCVDEPWKRGVLEPLQPATADKFDRIFSAEQKAYIEARLKRINF